MGLLPGWQNPCQFYIKADPGVHACCEHCVFDGYCSIASAIAGIPAHVEAEGCQVCLSESNPSDINRVTVSKALWALNQTKDWQRWKEVSNKYRHYLATYKIEIEAEGPGTELHLLFLSIGFSPGGECKCIQLAKEMNEKGSDWCEANIDYLAQVIQDEADRRGFVSYLAKFGARPVIRLAINRARMKEAKFGVDA